MEEKTRTTETQKQQGAEEDWPVGERDCWDWWVSNMAAAEHRYNKEEREDHLSWEWMMWVHLCHHCHVNKRNLLGGFVGPVGEHPIPLTMIKTGFEISVSVISVSTPVQRRWRNSDCGWSSCYSLTVNKFHKNDPNQQRLSLSLSTFWLRCLSLSAASPLVPTEWFFLTTSSHHIIFENSSWKQQPVLLWIIHKNTLFFHIVEVVWDYFFSGFDEAAL